LKAALLLLTSLGWTGLAIAASPQTPAFHVSVDAGVAFSATVHAAGVLDDEALENAVRSGLPLRLRFRTELWRDRLFDELVDVHDWSLIVVYEPIEGRFIVQGTGAFAPSGEFDTFTAVRAAIERDYSIAVRPPRAGRYYYSATLEIETLSLSDFEELENWLRGELRPAVAGERSVIGAVGQGVKRAVIRLLGMPAKRFEARSEKFESR